MKKNIGAQLALYPAPVIVVGAMVDGKPNWTLVAYADESVLNGAGKIDYHVFKPVLFEFPTYEYFVTGDKVGNCAKMN